jgi:hypothetical protein
MVAIVDVFFSILVEGPSACNLLPVVENGTGYDVLSFGIGSVDGACTDIK